MVWLVESMGAGLALGFSMKVGDLGLGLLIQVLVGQAGPADKSEGVGMARSAIRWIQESKWTPSDRCSGAPTMDCDWPDCSVLLARQDPITPVAAYYKATLLTFM